MRTVMQAHIPELRMIRYEPRAASALLVEFTFSVPWQGFTVAWESFAVGVEEVDEPDQCYLDCS